MSVVKLDKGSKVKRCLLGGQMFLDKTANHTLDCKISKDFGASGQI